MEIEVKRIAKRSTYTIGKVYVNSVYECDSIEDTDRGLKQEMGIHEITSKKVFGKTAIPSGRYEICMSVASPKYVNKAAKDEYYKPYCLNMPRIMGIKGYSGVLIHPGSTEEDTLGCLIVGENKVVGKVINSRKVFSALYDKLYNAYIHGEIIHLTIG